MNEELSEPSGPRNAGRIPGTWQGIASKTSKKEQKEGEKHDKQSGAKPQQQAENARASPSFRCHLAPPSTSSHISVVISDGCADMSRRPTHVLFYAASPLNHFSRACVRALTRTLLHRLMLPEKLIVVLLFAVLCHVPGAQFAGELQS